MRRLIGIENLEERWREDGRIDRVVLEFLRRQVRRVGPAPSIMAIRRIILDTDIGTDPDDCLALALVLASRELELVAVTTVYGDVAAARPHRAQAAPLAGHPGRPARRHGSRPAAAAPATRLLGRA